MTRHVTHNKIVLGSILSAAGLAFLLFGLAGCSGGSGTRTLPPPPPPTETPTPAPPTPTPTPTPVPNACLPGNALQVAINGNVVTAYLPNSDWSESNGTGITVAEVEGASPLTCQQIATTDDINSCAIDATTNQVICTSNGTNVYIISGTTLTKTVTSAGVNTDLFSGGGCATCNIASGTGFAAIGIGQGTDSDGNNLSGMQLLNLTSGVLGTAVTVPGGGISEAPSWDTERSLILNPNEPGNYSLAKVDAATNSFTFFDYSDPTVSLADELPDSAAEDCTTGIALASLESSSPTGIFLANLNQATFTPGTGGAPGTWDAPSQIQALAGLENWSDSTTGIAMAPEGHVGILEDEFGTTDFGAIQLPSTAGTGVPAATDWVAATMPTPPNGVGWDMPLDPHGLTAYDSPNTGKPMGIIVNLDRSFMALVDINALLQAPREGSTGSAAHTVASTVDLVATGIVKFIPLCPPPAPLT